MPSHIVKLRDKYFEYSTIVDAPISEGATLAKFKAYYRRKYGAEGMRTLPERLARVEAKGTSSMGDESAEDTLSGNRAGPNETELTLDELYRTYCLDDALAQAASAQEADHEQLD